MTENPKNIDETQFVSLVSTKNDLNITVQEVHGTSVTGRWLSAGRVLLEQL